MGYDNTQKLVDFKLWSALKLLFVDIKKRQEERTGVVDLNIWLMLYMQCLH